MKKVNLKKKDEMIIAIIISIHFIIDIISSFLSTLGSLNHLYLRIKNVDKVISVDYYFSNKFYIN